MKSIVRLFVFFVSLAYTHSNATADIFLATHILLNTLAVKYLPSYDSNTSHGAYITGSYGYRYELGDSYKTGSKTEGSIKSSPGFGCGYHFINSPSHKFALTYNRKVANYQTYDELEGKDVIDSFGARLNFGLLAFKLGWSSHAFSNSNSNKHDGGTYTGIGFDLQFNNFSFYMDLTDHYLEDRKLHLAGGDVGFRYHFFSTSN